MHWGLLPAAVQGLPSRQSWGRGLCTGLAAPPGLSSSWCIPSLTGPGGALEPGPWTHGWEQSLGGVWQSVGANRRRGVLSHLGGRDRVPFGGRTITVLQPPAAFEELAEHPPAGVTFPWEGWSELPLSLHHVFRGVFSPVKSAALGSYLTPCVGC